MPAGAPTKYSYELVQNICERLSNGDKLKDVLKDVGIVRSTFFKWKRENKEFSDLYVNVAHDKGELCIEEIDQTIEDLRNGKMEASVANVIIQSLKWKASKFYPKMFGDKLDVTTQGEKINTTFLSIDPLANDTDDNRASENSGA
jgi:hypothetical protein